MFTAAPAPSPICDAYSNGCVTPQPVPSISVSPAPKPRLPDTGMTGGDLVTLLMLALILMAVGAFFTVAARRRVGRQ